MAHMKIAARILFLTTVCLVTLYGGWCAGRSEKAYEVLGEYHTGLEYYPGEKWARLASPELAGWSTARLEEARQYSRTIHSSAVVVIDNGVVVDAWGNIAEPYNLHSVRKSIMSAMFGILYEQDRMLLQRSLKSLGITDSGGLSPKEREATVHDLLCSRSGVYHPAAYETEGMEEKRPPRGSHDPGTFWYYNNWDFNVLATIFNQSAGKDFFEEFYGKIAVPLQMEHFRPEDGQYIYEPEHSSHPAYLFRMSALDLARFGLLYLRQGRWREKQIIEADWVERSTEKYSIQNPRHPERGYGYLWWIDQGLYYAAGTGGQRLFVIPELKVVIVHRVDTDSRVRVKTKPIWTLVEKILAARNR